MTAFRHGLTLARPIIWDGGLTGIADTQERAFTLPVGTVTFLLSDIEGSTRLWEAEPEAMAAAVPAHYAILADAVGRHGGVRPVEQGEGDSVVAAFSRAADAAAAALDAQRAFSAQAWPGGIALGVRIALHTADAQLRDEGNYFGVALSRCARVRAIAHGGQTLLTGATHDLVVDRLPPGAELIDLGVHRLRDLGRPERVHGLSHPDLAAEFGPLRSLDALPNNLPDQLTSFVGRERELGEVREALGATRMLTLTGAGGCGKTRLAAQAAADALDGFGDGAWWVELAPLADGELAGQQLADALGVRPILDQSGLEAAAAHLTARHALVVLDNCEHVLDAAASIAEQLLHACPEVTVLATSRAPLRVGGETDWRVPSLSLPSELELEAVDAVAQSDAVRLFIERALKVRPNFAVTAANAPAIAQICFDLDGIPLAIELAAARVRVLAPDQIAAGLSDRFRLLTGGARSAMPRHQTLRASVDWSHELLSDEERTLFRRLAVFAGGWTLSAVEAVGVGDGLELYAVLDLLTSLVDKSLVVAEEHGPSVRYRLLATVRQYAQDRLAESADAAGARDRHRDFYLALAEQAAPYLTTDRQRDWCDMLDTETVNLSAAIEWAAGGAPESALALCATLTFWWKLRGRFAPAELAFERALGAASPDPSQLRARVLWSQGYLRVYAGNFAGLASVQEALTVAEAVGDHSTAARALDVLATAQMYSDPGGARSTAERSLELARAAGDDWCYIDATQILGFTYMLQDDMEPALAALDEALPMIERMGHREFLCWHWFGHGYERSARGELDTADELSGRCVALATEIGEPATRGYATAVQGDILLQRGEPEAALALLGPALERVVLAGGGIALGPLANATAMARAANQDTDGARAELESIVAANAYGDGYTLLGAQLALGELLRLGGDPAGSAQRAQQALDTARQLGNAPRAAAAQLLQARLVLGANEPSEAETLAHEALSTLIASGHALLVLDALDVLAEVAASLHAHEEAARLLGAADTARAALGGLVRAPDREHELAAIAALLEQHLGPETARAARAEGAALSLEDAVAWVRRARGTRKRPPGGWESLTPTERQVVELAAQGLTNPEIGERMFISRGTVKIHLSHIYAKLDVRNRSELTALVVHRKPTSTAPSRG